MLNEYISTGYVVFNNVGDIDSYIKDAIRRHRVIILEDGGTLKLECPVLNFETTNLVFPSALGKLGSKVLLCYPQNSRIPIVMGVIPSFDETQQNAFYDNENQRKFIKDTENSTITVDEDAENGVYNISVYGKVAGKSNYNISVSSANNDAVANVKVNGQLNITAVNNITMLVNDELDILVKNSKVQDKFNKLTWKLGNGLTIIDEFDNTVNLNSNGLIAEIKKDINLTIDGNTNINSTGKIDIEGSGGIVINDPSSIELGTAESLALNESCNCQYTGQRHLPPTTNQITKV